MRVDGKSFLTSNILLECVGPNGEVLFDTNKSGKFYALIGECIAFPEENNISKARILRYETNPFELNELTDDIWRKFDSLIVKDTELNWEQGSLVGQMPNISKKININVERSVTLKLA